MSVSVGSMSAGLGLDMTEFQRGMQRATEVARSNSTLMSAEMKRTSREGAESLRLIDEAIGVHISRPLTRIIGQSQLVGGALASVFALSAGVAIGTVFVEQGKKLLEMTGALEGWKELLGITGDTSEAVAKQMERSDTILLENLRRKASLQQAYNESVLRLKGEQAELAHLGIMQQETAEIFKQIAAQALLVQARANQEGWRGTAVGVAGTMGGPAAVGLLGLFGITQAKDMQEQQVAANKLAEAMKPLFDALKQLHEEETKTNYKIIGEDQQEAMKIAQGDLDGLNERANSLFSKWLQVNKALEDSPLVGDAFRKAFHDLPFTNVEAAANAATRLKDSLADSASRWQEFTRINGTFGAALAPPVPPEASDTNALTRLHRNAQGQPLGASDQQNELWAKAQQVVDSVETAQEKYTAGMEMLEEISRAHMLTTEQMTLAQQKLKEEFVQATDKLEALLRKTGDASAGFQAFFLQLQKTLQRDGAFTFEILSKGLDGFENATVQALTGGKAEWRKYFEELAQMALKFELNKLIGGALTSLGKSGIFGSSVQNVTATTQMSAAVIMQTAAAAQLTAANIMAAGGIGSATKAFNPLSFTAFGGGLASGGDLTPGASYIVGEQGPEPLTVDSSGSAFISPHASLREGSGGGTTTHIHNYDLRGEDPAVVQRLIAALPQVEERAVARAVASSSEIARRTANP
jgi:hypothetical protein